MTEYDDDNARWEMQQRRITYLWRVILMVGILLTLALMIRALYA